MRHSLSDQEQVDAAALLVQTRRSMAAAELGLFGVARKKKRRRGKGGMERTPGRIYKGKGIK